MNNDKSTTSQLAEIFALDPRDLAARLRRRFDEVCGEPKPPLILFGAGLLGRRTLRGVRRLGWEPVAFVDNNRQLWHTEVDGLRILSPEDAADQHGTTAAFVITVFNGLSVRRQLMEMKCAKVVSFATLYWRHPDTFLPFGALGNLDQIFDERSEVTAAAALWDDRRSRDYYLSQLCWRLDLDSEKLPDPCPAKDTYFPDDLVVPKLDEVFVDCGAFDGDSLRAFVARRKGTFRKVVALEPDPQNFAAFQRYAQSLDPRVAARVMSFPLAAASHSGTLTFDVHGDMSSTVSSTGTMTLDCARLDDILTEEPPTYIKMDIEGAELDALAGASRLIGEHHPVLAVCAYHKQNDLWRIPLAIKSLYAGYRLFLRVYAEDCWEILCYAVPEDRLVT